MPDDRYAQSRALFARAAQVIPGGIYGHTAPAAGVPGAQPYFAASVQGCRCRDVDGHEFIDFMCGYGPMLLGHLHPEVEDAADRARARGRSFNHPTELTIALAEEMVRRIDFAAWAVFAKNGSDLTTWALTLSRDATHRRKIIRIASAYHGTHPWCTPGHHGLLVEDRTHIHDVAWNDVAGFNRLLDQHGSDLAAVIVSPFHHPAYGDSILPTPDFVTAVHTARPRLGYQLILDDVRCFPRLHLGGSHHLYGWQPDLAVYSKAIGNGHALAACVGTAALRVPASRIFLTGSFWQDPVPLAAALKVLEIADREDVPTTLASIGRRFIDGFLALGEKHGLPLVASGPEALPYLRRADDPGFQKTQDLCAAAAAEGVYLAPHHNWFLSLAHTPAEIDEALARLDRALGRLAAGSTQS